MPSLRHSSQQELTQTRAVDKGQGGLRDTRADDDFKHATLMGFDLKSKSLFAFH